jgi:carbon-monoxide dehydrogenase medium subunit
MEKQHVKIEIAQDSHCGCFQLVHLTIRHFQYFQPGSIEEATSLLEKYGEEAKIIAGGTDLVPKLKAREIEPKYVIDITEVKNLNGIEDCREGLRIGAVTTYDTLDRSSLVARKAPVLAEAVHEVGNTQIRNLGTIGGNLANASPAADTAPPLIVSGASLKIVGAGKERVVPVEGFFLSANATVLRKDELLKDMQIPDMPPKTGEAFIKVGRRAGPDLSVASVAVALTMGSDECKDVRIALGSVGPTALRVRKAEDMLRGQRLEREILEECSEIVAKEVNPISDVRASAQHRIEVAKSLVRNAVQIAMSRSRGR